MLIYILFDQNEIRSNDFYKRNLPKFTDNVWLNFFKMKKIWIVEVFNNKLILNILTKLQHLFLDINNLSNMRILLLACLIIAGLAQNYPKQTPVIGIYTQTNDFDQVSTFQSYIASSYIKFIEMSGAQVVPILAFSSQSQIAALLPKINGVLFPGGDQPIDITQRWTLNAKFILEWAIKQNDAGNVFPVWGTCLGYETLAFLTSGSTNNMTTLSPVRGQIDVLNTMKFVSSDRGYILGDMPQRLISKLTNGQGVMFYNHHWIISMDTYNQNKNLSSFWKVITESTSPYNERFVAIWQARKYPFCGVQFHPQKTSFEWKVFADRSYEAVEIQQTMSNKFVEKARQSKNTFASYSEYQFYSIYNYNMYTTVTSFTTIYRFNQTKPKASQVQVKQTIEKVNLQKQQ